MLQLIIYFSDIYQTNQYCLTFPFGYTVSYYSGTFIKQFYVCIPDDLRPKSSPKSPPEIDPKVDQVSLTNSPTLDFTIEEELFLFDMVQDFTDTTSKLYYSAFSDHPGPGLILLLIRVMVIFFPKQGPTVIQC